MTRSPDPLEPLRKAWAIALHEGALRLLRHAVSHGSLALSDALEVCKVAVTRSSAEDLADRLNKAGLLVRAPGRPATYTPSAFGEAVLAFVDETLGAPQPSGRPTVVVLDEAERRALERAGFELYGDLRHAAVEIASLRRTP